MKVFITIRGDSSVGIPDTGQQIDFLYDDFEDDDWRELVRTKLKELYSDFGVSRVEFEDECGECGRRLDEGHCPNENCITNRPDDHEWYY